MSFRSVAIVAVASVGLLWLTFRASAPWDGTPVEVPRSGEPGSPVRTVDGPSGPGHPELKQMGEEQVVHSTTQTVEMSGEVFHLSPKSLRERVEHPSPRDDAGPELDDPREKRSDEKTSDAMRQCVLDTKVGPWRGAMERGHAQGRANNQQSQDGVLSMEVVGVPKTSTHLGTQHTTPGF